jgi:hypothetical protein
VEEGGVTVKEAPLLGESSSSGLAWLYQKAVEAEGTPKYHMAWGAVFDACRNLANRMAELIKQREYRSALRLFDPGSLAKVGRALLYARIVGEKAVRGVRFL